MDEILNIIHKTIYQFFDVCEDDEEAPLSDKDKLLLEVNKAICNNLKALEQEPCEDCISRQAVLDLFAEKCDAVRPYHEVWQEVKKLSSVKPEKCSDCISRAYIESIVEELENICVNSDEHILSLLSNIKNAPSITPQPERCEDCISRRAIIGKCEDTAKATSDIGEMNTGFIMALDFIADYAKHMPSVESERKPGKWIDKGIIGNTEAHDFMCSECGWHEPDFPERIIELHYCTNCGATMKGGVNCNAED